MMDRAPDRSHNDGGHLMVRVDLDGRGSWHVALPQRGEHVRCATLDEARRLASRYASREEPCELVIRDAYHRVLEREFVGGVPGRPGSQAKNPHR